MGGEWAQVTVFCEMSGGCCGQKRTKPWWGSASFYTPDSKWHDVLAPRPRTATAHGAAKEGGWQGSIMGIHPKQSTKSGSMTERGSGCAQASLGCRVQCAVLAPIGAIPLPLLDGATHPPTSNVQLPRVPVSAIQRTEVPMVKLDPKRA